MDSVCSLVAYAFVAGAITRLDSGDSGDSLVVHHKSPKSKFLHLGDLRLSFALSRWREVPNTIEVQASAMDAPSRVFVTQRSLSFEAGKQIVSRDKYDWYTNFCSGSHSTCHFLLGEVKKLCFAFDP
jgi:hypothetical protein